MDRVADTLSEVWDEWALPVATGVGGALLASRAKIKPRAIKLGDKIGIKGAGKHYKGQIIDKRALDELTDQAGWKRVQQAIEDGDVIIDSSPIGKGAIGRKIGDAFDVRLPSGSSAKYEIVMGPKGPSLKLVGGAGSAASAGAYGVQELLDE